MYDNIQLTQKYHYDGPYHHDYHTTWQNYFTFNNDNIQFI